MPAPKRESSPAALRAGQEDVGGGEGGDEVPGPSGHTPPKRRPAAPPRKEVGDGHGPSTLDSFFRTLPMKPDTGSELESEEDEPLPSSQSVSTTRTPVARFSSSSTHFRSGHSVIESNDPEASSGQEG